MMKSCSLSSFPLPSLLPRPLLLSSVLLKGNKSLPVPSLTHKLTVEGSNSESSLLFSLTISQFSQCNFVQLNFLPSIVPFSFTTQSISKFPMSY